MCLKTPKKDHMKRKHKIFYLVFAAASMIANTSNACLNCHPNSPGKKMEHTAAMDLTLAAEGTHTALRSGLWSDPATWSNGTIPGANSKVVVPLGVTVTYDVDSSADIFWLLVDGVMNFSTTVSTKLVIDTIVVSPEGAWRQGTVSAPIPANLTSRVIFSDRGAINMTWDTNLISRGLISHGETSIVGAEKLSHSKIAPAAAGSNTITLTSAPQGWRIGDTIVVPGTKFDFSDRGPTGRGYLYTDDVRQISAINGNTVTLSSPLTYDHIPPAGISPVPLSSHVANYTRNITYESANKDMSSNANIQRRGHFMCMHSDKVNVSYAAFNDMGRSNKSMVVDDPPALPMYVHEEFQDGPTFRPTGSTKIGTGKNTKGRYSVHFHLCGSDDIQSRDGTGPHYTFRKAIVCKGVSTMNNPGWSYSNHNSHVNMDNCLSFNTWGSGFVEESGNGLGHFKNCMAVRNGMNGANPNPSIGDFREFLPFLDLGISGHGFFYRGNLVDTIACIATGCDESGFAWVGKHGFGGSVVPAQNLPYPAVTNGKEMIAWEDTPISVQEDMVVYGSYAGINEYYSQPRGDGRSHLLRPLIWNVYTHGIAVNYGNFSGQVTVNDAVVLAIDRSEQFLGDSIGLSSTNTINDVVHDNAYVRGFNKGIEVLDVTWTVDVRLLSNSQFVDCTTNIYNPNNVLIQQAAPTNRSTLTFTPDANQNPSNIGSGFHLRGTKTDALGSERTGDVTNNYTNQPVSRFNFEPDALRGILAKGYYTDQSGTFIVLPYTIMSRLTTEAKTFYHKLYLDFENNENSNEVRGPNLGTFVDPGILQVPLASATKPQGPANAGESVGLVCPIPGAHMYFTTDGSTPTVTADYQPLGSTLHYYGPIPLKAGANTIKVISYAGVMPRSNLATFGFSLPGSVNDLETFRAAHGLTSDGSNDLLVPAGDGVPNLMKYAFNMIGSGNGQVLDLNTPNSSYIQAAGTAGLPLVGLDSTGKLKVTYIRRKPATSGIFYELEFSDDLSNGSWSTNPLIQESITEIDSIWEKDVVTDSVVSPHRFARVKVRTP